MIENAAGQPLMLWVVSAFLGISLLLYCLLAGADFGAGILELFMRRSDKLAQRKIIDRALGPVWEANHMWLILMVVILFTGFPRVYSRVSINLHIPLTAMLIGIIARGTSFTFRHYDAKKDGSQKPYNFFFIFSSVSTPFFLGVVTGALIPGGIDANPTGYLNGYVWPWLRPFPLALGLFTVSLFAFLAAVYLIGESPTENIKSQFTRRAILANIASVLSGGVVFFSASLDHIPLLKLFLHSPAATACLLLATLTLPILWISLKRSRGWISRCVAGAQVSLVLVGWLNIQFPVLVHMHDGQDLTFFNAAAPAATLFQLGMALIVGSGLILPALFYLFRVFKIEEGINEDPPRI